LKARLDLQRTITGLVVTGWKIGQRRWQHGRLEDRYLKARVLLGGQHACINRTRWGDTSNLLDEVRRNAVRIIPVNKKGYWWNGDPLNALKIRVELPYFQRSADQEPTPPKCEGTWNRKTFRETGCGKPAVGRFRVAGVRPGRKLIWLCALCAAEGV
jgi:hypothetical protein